MSTGSQSSMRGVMGVGVEAGTREARLRVLFGRVLDADVPTRSGLLDEARRSDPDLFPEIEELVGYHDSGTGALDRSLGEAIERVAGAGSVARETTSELASDAAIGPYRVVREIGQGGMGVVYEAEQDFPKRRVALKLIRPEFVSAELTRRFTHEAEMLALLDHPNIARLYQAGFVEDAVALRRRTPYMAMELVEGRSLRALVKDGRLAPREAIALVLRVCDAVEHAHRRGVIHRDLKPSNIMVDGRGEPRVLDFGVARLTAIDAGNGGAGGGGGAGQATLATSAGQILGTLGYMSPEQLLGDSRQIDTRADVYALGVILFELLTGQLPIDIKTMNVAQAAIAVRDQEPRHLALLAPELKGDLDAIIAKALDKTPDRRYPSAAALAQDLKNYLENRPVSARAPSALYQAAKFARRNAALVTAASLGVLALAGGIVGTSWYAVQATRESARATAQSDRATQVAELMKGLFTSVTPELSRGKDSTMREFFDNSVKKVGDDLTKEKISKLAAAEAFVLIANAYTSVSDLASGERYAARAAALFEETVGLDDERTHGARVVEMMNRCNSRRNPPESLELVEAAYRSAVERLGEDHARTLEMLNVLSAANSYVSNGSGRAIELSRELVAKSERVFGPEEPQTVHYRHNLARQLIVSPDKRQTEEAIAILEGVVLSRTRLQGADHPRTISACSNLARAMQRVGRFKEVIERFEPLAPVAFKVLGPSHDTMISLLSPLAECHEALGNFDQAVEHRRRIYEGRLLRFPPESDEVVSTRSYLCSALLGAGRCDQAEPIIKEQFEACYTKRGPSDHMTLVARNLQFRLAQCRGDLESMRALAEPLKGSHYEPKAKQAIEEMEAKTKAGASGS